MPTLKLLLKNNSDDAEMRFGEKENNLKCTYQQFSCANDVYNTYFFTNDEHYNL